MQSQWGCPSISSSSSSSGSPPSWVTRWPCAASPSQAASMRTTWWQTWQPPQRRVEKSDQREIRIEGQILHGRAKKQLSAQCEAHLQDGKPLQSSCSSWYLSTKNLFIFLYRYCFLLNWTNLKTNQKQIYFSQAFIAIANVFLANQTHSFVRNTDLLISETFSFCRLCRRKVFNMIIIVTASGSFV